VLAEASGREDRQGAQQYSASAFWALTGISAVAGVLCLATFRLIPWRAVFRTSDVRDLEAIRRVAPFYANSLWGLVKSKIIGKASDKNAYLNSLQAGLPGDVAAKVWFLGMFQRPELVDRYYASDIFAFAPIWDEGFGLPAVEAMATGLPVVTSRSGTLVETVVDGKTGILVEKNNPEELAEALLRLLNDADLREAMGRAGRQRVMGHFTWDRIAKGMHTRYTTLCAS
jgi:glycosyltransferase involved in cell wall biosynthesis